MMNIRTSFYFIGWLSKKFIRTLFQLPLKFHNSYLTFYQYDKVAGTFAWFFISALILVIGSGIALLTAVDTEHGIIRGVITFRVLAVITVLYYVTCVVQDQYKQFDYERKQTWKTLKDEK